MTDQHTDPFRMRVEAFLAQTGMKPSPFGWSACRDRSFVADLREGKREFKPSTIRKVDEFMRTNLPPDLGNATHPVNPSQNQAA